MDPLTIGSESPSARQSILGSLLRGRPRGTSQSHPSPPPHDSTRDSPPPIPSSTDPQAGHRRRAAAQNLQPSLSQSNSQGFSQMLRRRRSAGALAATATPQAPAIAAARTAVGSAPTASTANAHAPSHRIRLVPHLDSRRSLRFDPICRDVREGDAPLRIGRFTDRSGLGLAAANALGSNKLAFKSKVVSRAHAEIWCEAGGRFFIKDTKSSSGTFLNHVRLSPANSESRPSELRDGDLLQLGVDYQGGTEDIYKCVKIKIEVGREWQTHSNPFNANALKQLKAIAIPQEPPLAVAKKTISAKSALPDCCICLFAVTIRQALFIAPCSHAFHYKCIRPMLDTHHPAFSCPLCRTFANLEEDVEVEIEADDADGEDEEELAVAADGERDGEPVVAFRVVGVAATAVGERSDTGDASSRERERGDRDVGFETEVEPDTGASRHGRPFVPAITPMPVYPWSRAGRLLPTSEAIGVREDVDEEMEDADMAALPPLPEGSPFLMSHEQEAEAHGAREHSVSPVPVRMEISEGEGEGEGDMEAEGSGSGSAEGVVSDASGNAPHPKRKR
ncbi:SMAD/FHA domain-containing protein [Obba rivulosa]|uniref:SMAD/FHA domain-containing protein n=1 Tax=Obba rivulosa TaxID=1052685 RepID=A0A8E2J2C5_9APHY|nr:SMAD/FHA domain-containing protein [Obba rivulosa]